MTNLTSEQCHRIIDQYEPTGDARSKGQLHIDGKYTNNTQNMYRFRARDLSQWSLTQVNVKFF